MSRDNFDVCSVTQDSTDGRWVLRCYGFIKSYHATEEEARAEKKTVNRYESNFPNP
jgi:hypothetical protein